MDQAEAKEKYFEAVGRRKSAVARVRLFPNANGSFMVNERELAAYFPTEELRAIAADALSKTKNVSKFRVSAKLSGGGINGQAEALRHATARALLLFDADLRGKLKRLHYLKRDPRAKERRKFGLKKARKAPQWSKR